MFINSQLYQSFKERASRKATGRRVMLGNVQRQTCLRYVEAPPFFEVFLRERASNF